MINNYKIAGLHVAMETFGRTERQAQPYLCECEQMADITVCSNRKAIMELFPGASEDIAEYLSTGINFYRKLLDYDGFMLHASAVVVDEKAYLFSANSGTGKSTHTKLWLEYFGSRAYILNDDKPALRLIDGKWYAFGTPWSGKEDISVNTCAEVAGIAVVKRAEKNSIEPYVGTSAIFDIFSQVTRPRSYELREKSMNLLGKLISDVPIWKLSCNMELEAAKIAYQAMSAEKEVNR